VLGWGCAAGRSEAALLEVGPTYPHRSLASALAAAHAGDIVRVHGGTHPGPLVVDRSVVLEGVDWPILDGSGVGTVVTLRAPGAVLRGFVVQGSGNEPDLDHSGVIAAADGVRVEGNRLRDVLFGVFVSRAGHTVVKGNWIGGKPDLDEGRRGDAIRLWYSPDVLVEGNRVESSRDLVIWYSENCTFRDNSVEAGRYGIHLMYANGIRIERNRLARNAVGIYVMYSVGVTIDRNQIRDHRGPSGYALGFKDADQVSVTDNLLLDNRAGIFAEGTPFSPGGSALFRGNVLAFNEQGAVLALTNPGTRFEQNSFWENGSQASISGGRAAAIIWRGNYWSDDAGFDLDGDGSNDQPYRAERLFEGLTDREPLLRVLLYSPAAQALELAASTFPVLRPEPKLHDPHPAARPLRVPESALRPPRSAPGMAVVGIGLLGAALGTVWFARRRSGR
jgi:nitrous oxidase accessory protein